MGNLSSFFGDAVASGQSEFVTDPRYLPVGVYYVGYIKTWSNYNDHTGEQVFWKNTMPKVLNMYNDQWEATLGTSTGGGAWVNPNFSDTNVAGHAAIDVYEATNASEIDGGYVIVDYSTQADTWVDVCNHSGFGGYLPWVIGLGNYGGEVGADSWIRITVDGSVYTFKGALHYRNGQTTSSHERLFWGSLSGTQSTTSPFAGGMLGDGYSSLGTGNHHRTYYYTRNDMGVYTKPEESIGLPIPNEALPWKGFGSLRFDNSIRVEVKITPPSGTALHTDNYSNYAACAIVRDFVGVAQ